MNATAEMPAEMPMDINAETYPFEVVLDNLDRAACIHLYAAPEGTPVPSAAGGWAIQQSLHRFDCNLTAGGRGLRAINHLGEKLAHLSYRWKFIPNDCVARPGVEPSGVDFDPTRPQRFAFLDSICRFASGDEFRSFASGQTFLCPMGSGKLFAGAVGTVLQGTGRFRGLSGTCTFMGEIDPAKGFRGSLLVRVQDQHHAFSHRTNIAQLSGAGKVPDEDTSYLIFRGQKRDHNQRTGFRRDEHGAVTGLIVDQQLRRVQVDASTARGTLATQFDVGGVIGEMHADIAFNLSNPGAPGTNEAPIPFRSKNRFTFLNPGGDELGTIETDGGEGRTFRLALEGAPRQAALRFGAVQPILRGTGWFEGISGMLADNSAVGIAPHAIATLYVLRVHDPKGKYRAGGSHAAR